MTLNRPSTTRTPSLSSEGTWMLDWAWVGLVSGLGIPYVALSLFDHPLHDTAFALWCGGLGAVTGAPVGLLLRAVRARVRPSSYRAVSLFGLPLVLGLWGALVAMGGLAVVLSDAPSDGVRGQSGFGLAWVMGTIGAMLQTTWLAPTYPWWADDPGRHALVRAIVLPLVSIAIGAVTPFLGMAALGSLASLGGP